VTGRLRRNLLFAGLGVLALGCALTAALSLWLGEALTHAVPRSVGSAPADLPADTVRISRAPGGFIAGWFVPGVRGAGAVLLLHPIRTDRTAMLARARFLHRAGHAVLLIDMQAHGESPGARIGMGWHEARDVEAALACLARRSPGERLGVIGVSLGGAAAAYARPSTPPAAMVLEAVYPSLGAAVANRLRLQFDNYPFGEQLAFLAAPLLLAQAGLWLGVPARQLEPAAALAGKGPLLLIAGDRDRHTTSADTARLHRAAGAGARLWMVEGAGHEDLHAFDPAAYEARVGAFLARHLDRRGEN